MALIANRSLQAFVLGTQFGASASYNYRSLNSPEALNRNRFFGGFSKEFGTPAGYHPPYSIVLPLADGGITAVGSATGSGSATGYAARAMTGTGSASGSGTATAQAISSVSDASGTATGSGTATMGGAVNGVATGSASGSGSALMGAVIGILSAQGSSTGSGSVVLTATASIIAEGGGGSELSPSNLAEAVWAAAPVNPLAGSMAKKVNDIETNAKLIPAAL